MAVNAGNSGAAVIAMSGCCKHPGLSSSVVLYFLRAGVTARAGFPSVCWVLFYRSDVLIKLSTPALTNGSLLL